MINRFKQLLEPSKKKLGLSTGLYTLSAALPNPFFSISSFMSYGWPLPIYRVTAVMEKYPPEPIYGVSIVAVFANAAFWYLVGCKITQLYTTRRDKE